MPENGIRDRLRGVFLPVTTPFDAVSGETAPVSFRDNLRRWTAQGVDGFVLFGSTGEGVLLDEDEKQRLTAYAREVVPTGFPLVAGVGAESTRATVRQAQLVADTGAEVVLVHPPPYFGPYLPAVGLLDHYRAVADASPIPVLVYHMPKFTKVTIEAGLMAEITRHPNVVGLKDSSGDIKRLAEYTDACDPQARLFVGNGALLYTALELGAAGGILAVALLVPEWCTGIVQRFRAGDGPGAGELQGRVTPLHKTIVAGYGAVGVKAALDQLGYAGGQPRPPLRPLGERDGQQVTRALRTAGLV